MNTMEKNKKQLITKNIINEIEKIYIEKKSFKSYDLMEIAGKSIAQYIDKNFHKKDILFICGKGGNGGDGLIAARILKDKGWKITIFVPYNKNELSKNTTIAFNRLKIKPKLFGNLNIKKYGLIVDALFGVGITRNIIGKNKLLIEAINSSLVPIISIDIPSGINSDTGEVMGVASKCKKTLTFSKYKIGNVLLPGYKYCGKTEIIDIGINDSYFRNLSPDISLNNFTIWKNTILSPKIDDNKYTRGYTLVIGGPKSMTGAARLCAKAAQKTGSGIVVVAVNKNSEDIYYSSLTTQIVKSYRNIAELKIILNDPRINSVVVGPGLGTGVKSINIMKCIFATKRRIVIDADAITSFKNKFNLLKKLSSESEVIYTPHEGELFSLLPNITGNILEKCITAGKKLDSTIVLKSPNTVVYNKHKIVISEPGSKWLATAGSGDVLSGIIGALLAMGKNPFTAAGLGVLIHSEAGKIGGPGLTAETLIDQLPQVLKKFL